MPNRDSTGDSPRVFDWSDVRVSAFPTEVAVLRGSREDLLNNCAEFLSLAFYPPPPPSQADGGADPKRIFLLSRVHEDVTVVCAADSLPPRTSGAAPMGLIRDESRWGALQIWEGDAAVGVTGVVAEVTASLGDVDVLLYVSTVNTDVIVVPLDRLEDAKMRCERELEKLREKSAAQNDMRQQGRAAKQDEREQRQLQQEQEQEQEQEQQQQTGRSGSLDSAEAAAASLAPIPVMLSTESHAVAVGRVPHEESTLAMHALCGGVLGGGGEGAVFTLAETPLDGTCVVLAPGTFGGAPVDGDRIHPRDAATASESRVRFWPSRENPAVWSVLRISQGSDGHSTEGVMRPVVAALAKAGISIYYLSTMSDDFMLVPRESVAESIAALRDSPAIYVEFCDVEGI